MVLLDEFEKAHPEVSHILLQVLDDGHLTDARGRMVDFSHCVILMTSNLGVDVAENVMPLSEESRQQSIIEAVKNHYSPELVNRIDEMIVFNNLTMDNMTNIAQLHLDNLTRRLAAKDLTLDIDSDVKTFLAAQSYSEQYGARPLARTIQQHLENPLATMIIVGETGQKNIKVKIQNDKIVLNKNSSASNKNPSDA